jgi:glycosyltransferase involved in cell wall biosynthesis
MPNVILESLACHNTPVISFNCSGPSAMILDRENGLLVGPKF